MVWWHAHPLLHSRLCFVPISTVNVVCLSMCIFVFTIVAVVAVRLVICPIPGCISSPCASSLASFFIFIWVCNAIHLLSLGALLL